MIIVAIVSFLVGAGVGFAAGLIHAIHSVFNNGNNKGGDIHEAESR